MMPAHFVCLTFFLNVGGVDEITADASVTRGSILRAQFSARHSRKFTTINFLFDWGRREARYFPGDNSGAPPAGDRRTRRDSADAAL
jgi:hypothetical protein